MKNKIAQVTILIVGIVTMSTMIGLPLRSQPALLERARRVATAPSGYRLNRTYQWISPREVLAVLKSNNLEQEYQMARIRTDTGAISFLQQNNAVTRDAMEWQFSPDGQWYLCCNLGARGFAYYLCAADDSKRYKVYSETTEGVPCEPFAWLGDTQHWVSMPGTYSQPVEVRTLMQTKGHRQVVPSTLTSCSLILSSNPKHTVIRNFCNSEESVKAIEIGLWHLEATAKKIQKWSVPLPVPGAVIEIAVSPTGDRLAWLIHVREESAAYDFVRGWLHFLPSSKPHDSYQIWTSTLNGSSPKLLGTQAITMVWHPRTTCFPASWEPKGAVYNLRWTSDEQWISFTSNDSLYTVGIP